jgi:hypothetical protein
MAFRTTPQLGPELEAVIPKGEVWFDIPGQGELISPRLGTVELGSDGNHYMLVRASADIAAAAAPGTEVTITEPAFAAAAGAGGYYAPDSSIAPDGISTDDYFWARQGT